MFFTSRNLFAGWRAALLLAAVACATPQHASAGCGDHIVILRDPSATGDHLAPKDGAELSPYDAEPLPVRQPCRGPDCSDIPVRDVPPIAPPVPVGSSVKESAQCGGLLVVDDSPGTQIPRDTSYARPISRADSVFHPPRD
jgi:hypothetical protein